MRRARLGLLLAATAAPVMLAQAPPAVLTRLLWFDRGGQRIGAIGPVADHGNLELSPDGTKVAVAVTDNARATRDIWMYDTTSDTRTRFTSNPADENWLIWSPDGQRVLLNSFGVDRLSLFEAPSSGTAEPTSVLEGGSGKWPVSWSPDGRFVLYVTNGERTSNDIWVLLRDGSGSPYPYLRTEAAENWAAFSPDGRWVAFSATDSGQPEVYVASFPAPVRRWRISADGGSQPRWRRDGKEIFYLAPNQMLMAATISATKDAVTVEDYEPLFELRYPYGAYHAFDVTGDGQRFLVNTLLTTPTAKDIVVTHDAIDGRAPANCGAAISVARTPARSRDGRSCRGHSPSRAP